MRNENTANPTGGSMPHVPTSPAILEDHLNSPVSQTGQPRLRFVPSTAIRNCLVPTAATVTMLYLATVYGFFGMLRGGALTDNSVFRPLAQSWFFLSSFDFNFAPNIEFLQNFLLLCSALWHGKKGNAQRFLVIPTLLWAIAATMPGTAASVDSLESISNSKMFVGAGTAVFSAIFFVTRFTALVNFLCDLYFTIVLNIKLTQPQYALFRNLRNDLSIALKRFDRAKTFGDNQQFIQKFYEKLQENHHLDSRTMREWMSYCAEDITMGKLLPVIGAACVFFTFQNMANKGVLASERVEFLHPILSRIAGPVLNNSAATASAIFYYRTSAGFYNTMKNVLSALKVNLADRSCKARAGYSALSFLLIAQAYTSGGGLAEERLSAHYPQWLAWFNSWLVMAEAGLFVNGKAFGDFVVKICAKTTAPDITAWKALANYFFGAYHDKMPAASSEFTIEKMITMLEEAIVLHGLDSQGNLQLKSDGSSVLALGALKEERSRWMSLAPTVVVSPSALPASSDESTRLLGAVN